MRGQDLIPVASMPGRGRSPLPLTGPIRSVQRNVAESKAELESSLAREPNDYQALADLGELDLRVGLVMEAQALLYRASLLPPPSWEAFQRTSLLLRRAEAQAQNAFDRPGGAPPPFVGG